MDSSLPIAIVPVGNVPLLPTSSGSFGLFRHLADHFIPHHRNNYHPHIFSHRLTGLLAVLLVSAKLFTISALTFGPVDPAYSSAITRSTIINLTNSSRQEYGLQDLAENSTLNQAAQAKANDMLAKGYFSHNTPDGKTPWDFVAGAGYSYLSAGENLAVNFSEAENVEDAWMNSPGHKANILNKNFQEIGIGISSGQYQGHDAIFVVQMFGTPSVSKVALKDEPTSVVKPALAAEPVREVLAEPRKPVNTLAQSPKPREVKAAVVPAEQVPAPSAPALEIKDAGVAVRAESVVVTVRASASAAKVIAYFGDQGIILSPKQNETWEGSAPLSQVAGSQSTVVVKAFDLSGKEVSKSLASFSTTMQGAFTPTGGTTPQRVSAEVFGITFDPKAVETRFYLFFVAAMLAALCLAIGIKRHIQHLSVVANGSFVVILAALLLMAS